MEYLTIKEKIKLIWFIIILKCYDKTLTIYEVRNYYNSMAIEDEKKI